jgi:hypothetical protein
MGMTRATGGPVRCPWCARPVSDGPGSPEACPSCGVPLSVTLVKSRRVDTPSDSAGRRGRRSQRLRAVATVLALTAVMLVISAIGLAAALVRGDNSDSEAQHNLQAASRIAQTLQQSGGASAVTVAALAAALPGLHVADGTVASAEARQVSVATSEDASGIYGWYGAVKSKSGRCFGTAVVEGRPAELVLLPQNCTGEAARASLMPISTSSMVPTAPLPSGSTASTAGG